MDAVETARFFTGISLWAWLTGAALVVVNVLVHREERKALALGLLVPIYILVLLGLVVDFSRIFGYSGIDHSELPAWLEWFADMALVRIGVALAASVPIVYFARSRISAGFLSRNVRGIVPLIAAIVDTAILLGAFAFLLLLNPFP